MSILDRVSEIARLDDKGGNLQDVLRAFSALGDELNALPSTARAWLGRPETSTIFDAVFDSLDGRSPNFTATPRPRITDTVVKSHPRALSARLRNITATAAGRALIRLGPQLASKDMEQLSRSGQDYKDLGLTYRKQVAFFASLLSTPEGRAMTRLAASLAQKEWTQRFWNLESERFAFGHLIVGNGPVGIAFAHSLIEAGNFSGVIFSKSDASGPFGWGRFPVNHRSRPVGAGIVGGPATSWALDDLGPVLVSPSDISTSWGYATSDIIAAVTALNALAAGPVITGNVDEYVYDDSADGGDSEAIVMRVSNDEYGARKEVRFGQVTFATGLGRVREFPGFVTSIPVNEFLSRSEPSTLGKRVAVVGDGDSAMMAIARLLGLDGDGSTPRQIQGLENIVWVRKKGEVYKETFPIVERLRYSNIAPFLPRLLDRAYPHVIEVVAGRVIGSDRDGSRLYLDYRNERGGRGRTEVDSVINATGFDAYVNYDFDGSEGSVVVIDGIPVARQLLGDAPIYAIGAAAQLPVSDAERSIFPVLQSEKLSANTVALFRTVPAATAFGRRSSQVGKEQGDKKLLSSAKARAEEDNASESFERTLFVDVMSSGPSTLSQLLSRLRYLTAAKSESIRCDAPISIHVEMSDAESVVARSVGNVSSHVAREVLGPLFDDEVIRNGLISLCMTAASLEEAAADMLREDPPSRPVVISIPVDDSRLVATGLSLAA